MDNGSPPPSCPSNADNPPTHPHLARLYYNQPQAQAALLQAQCTSPTALQQPPGGTFFFQNPAPPTPASMQAAQIMYAHQQHLYGHHAHPHAHHAALAQSMHQCEACNLNFMQAAAHQLHAAQQLYYPQTPVQYVAPRNLPQQYSTGSNPPSMPMPPVSANGSFGGVPAQNQLTPPVGPPQQQLNNSSGSSPRGQVLWRPSAPPSFSGSDSKPSSDIDSPASGSYPENMMRPLGSARSRGGSPPPPLNPGMMQTGNFTAVPSDPPTVPDSGGGHPGEGSHHPYIVGPHLSQAKAREIKDDDIDEGATQRYHLASKEFTKDPHGHHQQPPYVSEQEYERHRNRTPIRQASPPPPLPLQERPPYVDSPPMGAHHSHSLRSHGGELPAPGFHQQTSRSNGPSPPLSHSRGRSPNAPLPRTEAFDIPFNDSPPRHPPPGVLGVKLREKKRESLRMDIALDDVPTPSEFDRTRERDRAKRASVGSAGHLEATAFTITFSDDEKPVKPKKEQQDDRLSRQNEVKERLAQKHMMRRSMKKYGPGSSSDHSFEKKSPEVQKVMKPNRGSFPSATKDGKRYLLDKMLNVDEPPQAPKSPNLLSPTDEKDSEIRSEAGTYVLEDDDNVDETQARKEIEKVFAVTGRVELESEEEEDSKTPSPDLDAPEPVIKPTLQTANRITALKSSTGCKYQKRAQSAHRLSAAVQETKTVALARNAPAQTSTGRPSAGRSGNGPSIGGRLYQKAGDSPRLTAQHDPPGMVGQGRRAQSFVRANQTRRSVIPVSPVTQERAVHNAKAPGVARGDGGRFSMRGSSAAPQLHPSTSRPKTKSTSTAGPEPPKKPAETPEMNAWLRRKKYNPMKAAAEDKIRRKEQATAPGPNGDAPHLSTRSASFHAGLSLKTTSLSLVKTEIAEELSEYYDEEQGSPTDAIESITDVSSSTDKEFVSEVDKLTRELGLMAEETLCKLRASDVTLAGGSQVDLSECGTAQDRILAQLQSAKQAMYALNNHLLRHADSTESSQHSTACHDDQPESPTSEAAPPGPGSIPHLEGGTAAAHNGGSVTLPPVPPTRRISTDVDNNDISHKGAAAASAADSGAGSDTDPASLHLQETLNCLKPYWDKRTPRQN